LEVVFLVNEVFIFSPVLEGGLPPPAPNVLNGLGEAAPYFFLLLFENKTFIPSWIIAFSAAWLISW